MSHSGRLLAVVALWLAAIAPLAMLALGALDPVAAVRTGAALAWGFGWTIWGGGVLALIAVVLYPPFLPALRLRARAVWRRLGTSDAPVREAYARLAQFESVNDLFLVGRHLRERGTLPQAVEFLSRAVGLDPTHIGARYQLALAHRGVGDLQQAVDGLQDVLARDPQHAFGQPLLDLAEILTRAKLHAEAAAVLARYRQAHGDCRKALLMHARALAGCRELDASRAALNKAAAPTAAGERLDGEDALARGRARVALWLGGYR